MPLKAAPSLRGAAVEPHQLTSNINNGRGNIDIIDIGGCQKFMVLFLGVHTKGDMDIDVDTDS